MNSPENHNIKFLLEQNVQSSSEPSAIDIAPAMAPAKD
jgi:hypothetical protein